MMEVFETSDGWFFRDEPEDEPEGPFETEEIANKAYEEVTGKVVVYRNQPEDFFHLEMEPNVHTYINHTIPVNSSIRSFRDVLVVLSDQGDMAWSN